MCVQAVVDELFEGEVVFDFDFDIGLVTAIIECESKDGKRS